MGIVESVLIGVTALIGGIICLVQSLQNASSSGQIAPNPIVEENEERICKEQERAAATEAEHKRLEERQRDWRSTCSAWSSRERRRRNASSRQTWGASEGQRQAHEERARAEQQQKIAEEERKKAEGERRLADERQQAAEEERQRAEEDRARADEQARLARIAKERAEQEKAEADDRAKQAAAELEEAQRKLREGVRPVVIPTSEEFEATKKRLCYQEGIFHFAIAGISGSGKSSLINAFRGLHNSDHGAAPTGVTETTSEITRYPDPNRANPWVWYDVPGAGTLTIPDWAYFNQQGLYVFDCIIVLFDNRFTATDVAILKNCRLFNIPAYIVRSKSNQHISNILSDMGYDNGEEHRTLRRTRKKDARDKYITETRASVAHNLEEAGLPLQRVYVVSKETLLKIVKQGHARDEVLDELELLTDLLTEARRRRLRSVTVACE
ncbi:nucleoside triphosphate hydrolase protein [Wolfiporia cocos MD-104 SS10]|uniref:Nucleoside triphosphate hydrolase protein n=1 Tax=Wolfiporia cocos (strain MD-104) TaxID=742152 RepID=A0A2H3J5Y7_WOLCO|nr:nucleoside triphosphate hydrolase protein [Wolfiporia cocos MD-104 SS10]